MTVPSEAAPASSRVASTGQPVGSPPRSRAKRGAEATTTTAVEPVAPKSDGADKLSKLDVSGVDKQSLDKVSAAEEPLNLTKDVVALKAVADQTTTLTRVMRDVVLEHDARLAQVMLRIDVLEKRAGETDETHKLASTSGELLRQNVTAEIKAMMEAGNDWEGKLDKKMEEQ